MKIAIIGGGITGLTAAYELTKKGHRVTVFEKSKELGGLAHGFKRPEWDWHLESAYHHLFTNDTAILNLMKELGLSDKLILTRPMTANFIDTNAREGVSFRSVVTALAKKLRWRGSGADIDDARTRHADQSAQIIPFDSPIHLLTYPDLSVVDKLRTGLLIIFIKCNPFWQPFEWLTAKKLFVAIGGSAAWKILWEPLMIGKFGKYADHVAASWLWARIKKRTQKLYYIKGGFHTLISALEQTIKAYGGTIVTNVQIPRIELGSRNKESGNNDSKIRNSKFIIHNSMFDTVLLTVPTPIAKKLIPPWILDIGDWTFPSIPHLHAQTLILETTQPILQGTTLRGCKVLPCEAKGIYWLNILDKSFPFLAVVAHTNMIDPKHYGGHHLTYFGNYLPSGHPYLSMTKKQLLKVFLPFIKRLKPGCQLSTVNCQLFTGMYAQPVHELHYSRRAPKLETPIPGIFLANMDSIYPWDRGTNYAVELGIRAGRVIIQSDQYMRKQID